ncbi:MAG: DUF342 domain-containing protein [Lachnospiraceae bacterium]|nr:DUF342 domain-containing protein [Lachnospiraceae bacterium]
MNAYFQIISKGGKCSIKVYPATDGGENLRREELVEYLQLKDIMYDPKDLMAALISTEELEVPTPNSFTHADGEFVKINISPDNMTVTARVIAPFEGGEQMSLREFMSELSSRGIVEGIDNNAIDDFLKNRQYCTDIVVARGTPAKQGHNASIEYFFNTDPRVRPTLNEDGSVDFFNLNTINHCKKGDLLARLTPAVHGEPGVNVRGEKIRPADVKAAILKFGRNITQSEDKTELYSDVSGHVSLVEGKVFVSNILEVENVDNSVGNIDYEGSVKVNGNVCENFSVKAQGSIEVVGVVEGAYLEAGENITIAHGMNGMHKGVLKAGGNIVSKFLENATATAEGYIDAESILHSNVVAGTEVHVTGKRGFITGGKVCATVSISVKNLGSQMGADTIVEVGVDATVKQAVAALQKEIAELNKSLSTIKPVLEGAKQKLQAGVKMLPDQLAQIQKLATVSKNSSARLAECMQELEQYQSVLDADTQGQVIVTGDVYPGTKICIGDVSTVVKGAMKYCRFIKEGGDVKMTAIY